MGVSIYPVLNRDVPGFDVSAVDGKVLARVMPEGENSDTPLARLWDFMSANPEDAAAFLEREGVDTSAIEINWAEEWFSPADGLAVVRAALASLEAEGSDVAPVDVPEVVRDLRDIESVLLLAQEHGAQFHFAIDF